MSTVDNIRNDEREARERGRRDAYRAWTAKEDTSSIPNPYANDRATNVAAEWQQGFTDELNELNHRS